MTIYKEVKEKKYFSPLPRSLSIFLVPSLPFFTFLYSPLYLQNKPKLVSLTNSWHLPQKLCFFTQILVSTPRLFDISAFFATGSGGAAGQREGQEARSGGRARDRSLWRKIFNQYRPVRGRNNKGLADHATATAPCVTGFCVLQEFSFSS